MLVSFVFVFVFFFFFFFFFFCFFLFFFLNNDDASLEIRKWGVMKAEKRKKVKGKRECE